MKKNKSNILKDSTNFSLEEKEAYLKELSKELFGDSMYNDFNGRKIPKVHFTTAAINPDKKVEHKDVVEDLISLYEDVYREQNGLPVSKRMGECIFTTKGK